MYLYTPVILIDSVNRKNDEECINLFLETLKKSENFLPWDFKGSS